MVTKLDVEGSEIIAEAGAPARDDLIYVYEDWPNSGMRVTAHMLAQNYLIFAADGVSLRPIKTAAEAQEYCQLTGGGHVDLLAIRRPLLDSWRQCKAQMLPYPREVRQRRWPGKAPDTPLTPPLPALASTSELLSSAAHQACSIR